MQRRSDQVNRGVWAMSLLSAERILIVNDDGIEGPGLILLEKLVRAVCEDVWVIAPDEERSGASHSLSITVPVRIKEISHQRYAVKGTPTDCVLLAYYEIMKDKPPTLLLSGINRGANLGEDITYSGTTSAALEGVLLGMKSIALSQIFSYGNPTRWETSEKHAIPLLEKLLSLKWPHGIFYNINFPDAAPEHVSGIKITKQGRREPGSFIPEQRFDGRELPYYWIRLLYKEGDNHPDSDLAAAEINSISVTPLQPEMTNEELMLKLREYF